MPTEILEHRVTRMEYEVREIKDVVHTLRDFKNRAVGAFFALTMLSGIISGVLVSVISDAAIG